MTITGSGVAITNAGVLTAGAGGAGGIGNDGPFDDVAVATVYNGTTTSSTAIGGNGGNGGTGGIGVLLTGSGATLVNTSSIFGGAGGTGGTGGGSLVSRGEDPTSAGGAGGAGGNGGIGVSFVGQGGTFTNSGTVTGGAGGNGGAGGSFYDMPAGVASGANGGAGGTGGIGAVLTGPGATLTNTGTITGGAGGYGGASGTNTFGIPASAFTPGTAGAAGAGGIGVFATSSTINNVGGGTITGGNGGAGGGAGGIGIVGSNLVIANAGGTINGGFTNIAAAPAAGAAPAAAPFAAGPQNYAIAFTGGTNTVGTGGAINGGIYVGAGALFQPQLNANPVGTPLAVNGPVYFAGGSVYNIRITPTATDSTVASGTATLNGAAVNVAAANGTYSVRKYTILTAAAGVAGTFGTLTTTGLSSAFLKPTLSYDANDVYLSISPTSPTQKGTPNYRLAAITYNQIAVADGLTNAGIDSGGRGQVLHALNQLSAPQARNAFDALSGEGIAGAQNVAFRSSDLFTSSIFDQTTFYTNDAANSVTLCEDPIYRRTLAAIGNGSGCAPIRELADLPARQFQPIAPAAPTRTWRAWATGWGGTEHFSGNAFPVGSAAQTDDIFGGTLGVDYQVTPNYLFGVAVGGSNGNFRVDERGTFGTTTGGHIAIYDLYQLGPYYGASSTAFSYFGNRTTRFVTGFGGLGSETERGNFDSDEFRSRLEFGRTFSSLSPFGGLPALSGLGSVTPFIALEIAELRSNGFTETSVTGPGLFRLNVNGQSVASVPGYVGLRFQRVTPLGDGMVLSPTLELSYVHEFAPYRTQIGTITSLPGSTFLVDGAQPARDSAKVKAGAELALGPHSAIFANFEGEFSGIDQLYAGKGGFRYTW